MSLAGIFDLLPLVFYIVASGVFAVLYLFSIVWSFFDARSRGRSGLLAAVLVALLVWPLGFAAWVLFRPAKCSEPNSQFEWSRKHTLGFCSFTIAMFVIGFTFVAQREYEVIALLRVQPNVNEHVMDFAGYEAKKNDVSTSIASIENIALAVRNATGMANPALADAFANQLEVIYPGNSEILSLAVRGRRIRNDQEIYADILNELVRIHLTTSSNENNQLLQNATLVARF